MKRILLSFVALLALTACSNEATTDQANEIAGSEIIVVNENEQVNFETIDLDEIDAYVNDGYIIADVREIDEFAAGHIPGAINAPLSFLQEGDFSALDSNEKYVIICRSGNRSVAASDILSSEGFDVVNVSEGMSTWTGEIEK